MLALILVVRVKSGVNDDILAQRQLAQLHREREGCRLGISRDEGTGCLLSPQEGFPQESGPSLSLCPPLRGMVRERSADWA